MKKRNWISTVLNLSGFLLALLTVCIVVSALHAQPVMLKAPDAARLRAEAMMDAVCSGKYAAAATLLYGKPNLGTLPESSSPAADQLWNTYRESLEYSFDGDCYATGSGAAIDVTVRCLDVPRVLEELDGLARKLLDQQTAESSAALFEESGQLLPSVSDSLLSDAMQLALGTAPMREQRISLCLTRRNGIWWVMPDDALLNILSGSFSG